MQNVDHADRDFRFQTLVEFELAGVEHFLNLLADDLADKRDRAEVILGGDGVDVAGQVADRAGGITVRHDAMDDLAFDLQHVGDIVENIGYLAVGHARPRLERMY